jgi:prolipoprotein diacylglyceryltransferase
VRRSTGNAFVLPLAVGIAVGRLGCLFSGLPDFTYGVPSALPWAIDLGDGIARHPVQLYESLAMGLFALTYVAAKKRSAAWARQHAFQALTIVYAIQRFAWEFVKPYPLLVGPLNVFHLLMLGLIAYGGIWWRFGGAYEPGRN